MFKPTRGPQKPTFKQSGISPFQLIKFLENYKNKLDSIGEKDSAFRIEMLVDYFEQDYHADRALHFDSSKLGF